MITYKVENKRIIPLENHETLLTFEENTLFLCGRLENSEKTTELLMVNTDRDMESMLGINTEDIADKIVRIGFTSKEEVYMLLFEIAQLYEIMLYEEGKE